MSYKVQEICFHKILTPPPFLINVTHFTVFFLLQASLSEIVEVSNFLIHHNEKDMKNFGSSKSKLGGETKKNILKSNNFDLI